MLQLLVAWGHQMARGVFNKLTQTFQKTCDIYPMLVWCWARWPNIKPALDKCHMLAGIGPPHHMIHWEKVGTKKLFRFALTTMLCKDNAKAKKAVAVYLSSKQTLFFGLARQTTYPRDALQSARNKVLLVKLDTLGIINNSGIFISMLVSKTFFVLTKCFNK